MGKVPHGSTGSLNRRTAVHTGLGKKQEPISKISRAKKAGGMAQEVKRLPLEHGALSLNPSTDIFFFIFVYPVDL
jgi:hypothetical protein